MINTSALLKNTDVNVYTTNVAVDAKGAIHNVFTLKYANVPAKIESKEIEVPITLNGAEYRQYYLMMTWTSVSGDLYEINDSDIIEDAHNGKKYLALEPQPGSLMMQKPYKLETKLIVYADDRFTNNQKPI